MEALAMEMLDKGHTVRVDDGMLQVYCDGDTGPIFQSPRVTESYEIKWVESIKGEFNCVINFSRIDD